MLKTKIVGEGPEAALIRDQGLLVSMLPYPPKGILNQTIPFVSRLTIGGDGSTSDLTVDGSTISVDAFVTPGAAGDLYLTTANILVADSGAVKLNEFGGAGGGLTVGLDLFVELENDRFLIASEIKTNFDLIRIGSAAAVGGKIDAFQIANTNTANEDGYNIVLDLTMLSPHGIRLRADTPDKFGLTINDDLTGVGTFDVLITGYIRI